MRNRKPKKASFTLEASSHTFDGTKEPYKVEVLLTGVTKKLDFATIFESKDLENASPLTEYPK